ncbi:Integrase regulator R [plant metagenome]|uniref:Integrase regulator R n=1 Tax=plant metagenome TaxID=1297885 RepID=A0A484Q0P5_9ZZZZ
MTASTRFIALEQASFQRLEYAGYLKGLLKPFKSKGALDTWASQCDGLRDDLIVLAQRQVLAQARSHPFNLLPIQLAQQTTGAGTTFLRWRNLDRSSMGVALWQEMMANPATPLGLIGDLHAMEVQRAVLNMQISLLHTLARQARDCAGKLAQADDGYLRRIGTHAHAGQPGREATP